MGFYFLERNRLENITSEAKKRSKRRIRIIRELFSIQVVEAHTRGGEAQVDGAGWTIALLGDD